MPVSIHWAIHRCKQAIRSNNGLKLDTMTAFVPTVNKLLKVAWATCLLQCSINKSPDSFSQSTLVKHPLSIIWHSPVKYLGIVKIEHSKCMHGMNHEINC